MNENLLTRLNMDDRVLSSLAVKMKADSLLVGLRSCTWGIDQQVLDMAAGIQHVVEARYNSEVARVVAEYRRTKAEEMLSEIDEK